MAVAADGSRVYLATADNHDLSVWRKNTGWERVLSRQGITDCIVRLAPEDGAVVYVARKGGPEIFQSDSAGEGKWAARTCTINVQDLEVESADTAYALDSAGSVTKTVNYGLSWGAATPTTLNSGATISCPGQDILLAGSQDGYVAYSTDGNLSWNRITVALDSDADKVQVVADEDFATDKTIYAASDTAGQSIKKWQIGTSTAWTNILSYVPGGIYGLAVNEGNLYALEFNASTRQSTLWYLTSPASATGASSSWSFTTTTTSTDVDNTEVWLNAAPRALVVSPGKAWAVKTNGVNKLYSFSNVLPESALLWPAQGYIDRVNKETGRAYDIAFGWPRPLEATAYELQIAFDKNFINLLAIVPVATKDAQVSIMVGPGQAGAARVDFEPGSTCYWRMRTTQPGYGAYSETRSFTVEPTGSVGPRLLTPANGSSSTSRHPAFSWEPASGVSEYQFVLSDNVAMTSPVIDTRVTTSAYIVAEALEYGRTYFWRIRPAAPTVGAWTIIANFTVASEETAPAPPLPAVTQQESLVLEIPAPPPATSLLFPPPAEPERVVPGYLNAALIISFTLLLGVVFLIIRPLFARPSPNYGAGIKNPAPARSLSRSTSS